MYTNKKLFVLIVVLAIIALCVYHFLPHIWDAYWKEFIVPLLFAFAMELPDFGSEVKQNL